MQYFKSLKCFNTILLFNALLLIRKDLNRCVFKKIEKKL